MVEEEVRDEAIKQSEDSEQQPEEPQEVINVTDDFIKDCCSNTAVIDFVKSKFKRINTPGVAKLIKLVLKQNSIINITQIMDKWKGFLQHNKSKFDEQNRLKVDEIKKLMLELNGLLLEMGKEPVIQQKGDCEVEMLSKNSRYTVIRRRIEEELGDAEFHYDFEKSDLDIKKLSNSTFLQRSEIQIVGVGVVFDYPVQYVYNCPQCGQQDERRYPYQVQSTGSRIKCQANHHYLNPQTGEMKSKICMNGLAPDNTISEVQTAYYYDIIYDDRDGQKISAGAIAFEKYKPGFYDCVLFKLNNPKGTLSYHLMDIKPVSSNTFDFPEQTPEENYLFTLQKACDKYIKEKSGINIYGLVPIKAAMLVQTIMNLLGFRLIANIQIVGDASTGKSTVLKYYGYLLNDYLNLSTNGISISVPALRGTRETVTLLGKEVMTNSYGYLGTFKSIHIDETGENKELTQNLKTFLLEDNYSYNKAGSTGAVRTRTTHINISENLDFHHASLYTGSVRKSYKDFTNKIGEDEKPEWSEDWDLFKPLHEYTDNQYLRHILKEKRQDYKNKQTFWVDGHEFALHERFPFYFYLVNEKENEELNKIVKQNVANETISENLQLTHALKTDDLKDFMSSLVKYKQGDDDETAFNKVDTLLDEYGIHSDARTKIFYYTILKISRVINKRTRVTEQDYDLVRWFIERLGRKLDVLDTTSYAIIGPPDLQKIKEVEMKIEDSIKETQDDFGLPEDDF